MKEHVPLFFYMGSIIIIHYSVDLAQKTLKIVYRMWSFSFKIILAVKMAEGQVFWLLN